MSKRQEAPPLSDRVAALARSLTLTIPERIMVAAILLSILLGSLVRHYRREYRLHHPIESSPLPHRASY